MGRGLSATTTFEPIGPLRLGGSATCPPAWSRVAQRDAIPWWQVVQRGLRIESAVAPIGSVGSQRRSAKMARLEAALLVTDAPLSPRRLAQVAALADATEARTLINRLNAAYEISAAPFRIERVAAGYRLLTLPQFAFWLGKLHQREAELKLSPPAMETLTVVAYRQPITRADVEAIRGVQCSEMIKQLMERGLVRIGGEDDSLGRPFLYETTRRFLEFFGLRDLEDLPLANKLRRPGGSGTPAGEGDLQNGPSTVPLELGQAG